jgi:hypothetical protein
MLACPQDLFFQNEMNGKTYHDSIEDKRTSRHHHYQQQQRKDSLMSTTDIDLNTNDMTTSNHLKDKEEQVWPPEVESAFIEGMILLISTTRCFLLTYCTCSFRINSQVG